MANDPAQHTAARISLIALVAVGFIAPAAYAEVPEDLAETSASDNAAAPLADDTTTDRDCRDILRRVGVPTPAASEAGPSAASPKNGRGAYKSQWRNRFRQRPRTFADREAAIDALHATARRFVLKPARH